MSNTSIESEPVLCITFLLNPKCYISEGNKGKIFLDSHLGYTYKLGRLSFVLNLDSLMYSVGYNMICGTILNKVY